MAELRRQHREFWVHTRGEVMTEIKFVLGFAALAWIGLAVIYMVYA